VRYRTLIDHISDHNPSASKKIAARIRHVLEHAAQRPLMFRVEATTILVVAVLHARQIYP
jgi:plasmid stabilization system protein ParE